MCVDLHRKLNQCEHLSNLLTSGHMGSVSIHADTFGHIFGL